ncbi:MAG: hypothetical protein Q8N16_03055, partial [bacterium]|nr:hypothetical protein [bacterium]
AAAGIPYSKLTIADADLTIAKTTGLQAALDLKSPLASPTFTGTVTVPVGLTGVLRADTGVLAVDADVTDLVDNIAVSKLADGTAGNLITWSAAGAPATVATGTTGQVLTSGGAGVAPTFQTFIAELGGTNIWTAKNTFSLTNANAVTISGAPAASTVLSLVLLDATPIVGGSASGTYIGANPTGFVGNFIDLQLAGVSKFAVSSAGAVTAASTIAATGAVTGSNLSGTNTGDSAANSSATFIGTTSVALNRTSAALTLAGITLTTPDIGVATATSVAIGGGTTLIKIVAYAPSLTPVATAAAIGTSSQTFAVTGLAVTDKIIVNGPAPTALCPMVSYRVSLLDTLQLDFATLTAVACTPAAGTYNIVAIRN